MNTNVETQKTALNNLIRVLIEEWNNLAQKGPALLIDEVLFRKQLHELLGLDITY